ncbi:universal stress protein [Streptomyces bambusae]|uniref:Universal stress protein n=1 Tax=Streptomyces bambusae TaxID=1550616 RepID=A0ABS6YXW9_9ACTN|nr:universal stress protein [Streptomyces bambusae]MBW5480329.1 universal stress protein [Streptomyces bambusae]
MTAQVTAGIDGSQESLAAAAWAARAAVLREVPLRLVHVEEWPVTPEIPYQLAAHHAERSSGLLRDVAEQARKEHPGLEVTTEHQLGRVSGLLSAAADESDLTVLGSRGLGGLVGFLIGSVSLAVVGTSRTPVVLVRADGAAGADDKQTADVASGTPTQAPRPESSPGGILVGVDLGHPSEPVLAFAFAEAARRGGTLRVLHSWTLPRPYAYAAVADPGIGELRGQQVAQRLADAVRPWRAMYPGVHVTEEAVVGAPGPELVKASRGAELLVVGRRKRKARLGPHIGHVAHAVIHHCAAPVAVVPVG